MDKLSKKPISDTEKSIAVSSTSVENKEAASNDEDSEEMIKVADDKNAVYHEVDFTLKNPIIYSKDGNILVRSREDNSELRTLIKKTHKIRFYRDRSWNTLKWTQINEWFTVSLKPLAIERSFKIKPRIRSLNL